MFGRLLILVLSVLPKHAMSRAAGALANVPVPRPLRLPVMGRVLELPAGDGRVARAGFWDLCGKPLGPADYLALTGDAVDNIPGISGIGAKSAAVLLAHFDTLDALLARIDDAVA